MFLSSVQDLSIGYNDISFFEPGNIEDEQIGYRIDPKGESLIGIEEGDWKEHWVVFANDNLGDPIFLETLSSDLTVYSAIHSNDDWQPIIIADSLHNFKAIIELLKEISKGRDNPSELEENPISEKERKNFLTSVLNLNPKTELYFWELFLENE